MSKNYIVRFTRKDGQDVEEISCGTYEEAFVYLALFRDIDCGIYSRIEIIEALDQEISATIG
jgi:hypothetical protein